MGTYYQLYVADYPLLSGKGEIEPIITTIFRESDKRVFDRKVSERNQLGWGNIDDDGEMEKAYDYTNTITNITQRLEGN